MTNKLKVNDTVLLPTFYIYISIAVVYTVMKMILFLSFSDRQFKNNASFVSRFSTRRRDRSTGGSNHSHSGNPHSPLIQPRKENNRRTNLLDQEEVPDTLHR